MSGPVCKVMVGLPASGKSTRVRDIGIMDPDVFVYSTDNYIEQCAKLNSMTYDQAFSEFIEPATKQMNSMLDIAIRSRQDIVWDQTNLSVKKRRSIIQRMQKAGYAVDCECFVKPETVEDIAEWNRRLNGRPGKTIPEHIVKNMMNTYVVPSVEEGFECVNYWTIYGNLIGVDYGEMQHE